MLRRLFYESRRSEPAASTPFHTNYESGPSGPDNETTTESGLFHRFINYNISLRGHEIPVRVLLRVILGLCIFAGSLVGVFFFIKLGYMRSLLTWVQSLGLWGHLVMVLLLAATVLPFATGWMLVVMSCGFLYGFWKGFATVIVGTYIGTALAFWLSRRILQQWVRRKISSSRKLTAVLRAVDHHAIKFVPLMRFTPLPVGMTTAICSLTEIPAVIFLPLSFFVQIFHCTLFTFVGGRMMGSLTDIIEGRSIGKTQIFMASSGIVMLVATVVIGGIIGKRAIARLEQEDSSGESSAEGQQTDLESGKASKYSDVTYSLLETASLLRGESVIPDPLDILDSFPTLFTGAKFSELTGIPKRHQSAPANIYL